MYATSADWESHYRKVESLVAEFATKKGTTGESATTLLEALKLRDQEITASSFSQAMYSKDRRYRRDAFLALHESFLDVKNTLATTLVRGV